MGPGFPLHGFLSCIVCGLGLSSRPPQHPHPFCSPHLSVFLSACLSCPLHPRLSGWPHLASALSLCLPASTLCPCSGQSLTSGRAWRAATDTAAAAAAAAPGQAGRGARLLVPQEWPPAGPPPQPQPALAGTVLSGGLACEQSCRRLAFLSFLRTLSCIDSSHCCQAQTVDRTVSSPGCAVLDESHGFSEPLFCVEMRQTRPQAGVQDLPCLSLASPGEGGQLSSETLESW